MCVRLKLVDSVDKYLAMRGSKILPTLLLGRWESNTTIGVELAAKVNASKPYFESVLIVCQPKLLLFLDEPTPGLDSQSAWAIMNFLCELADRTSNTLHVSYITCAGSVPMLNLCTSVRPTPRYPPSIPRTDLLSLCLH